MTPVTDDEPTVKGARRCALPPTAPEPEQNMPMNMSFTPAAKWTRRCVLLVGSALLCGLCGCGVGFTGDGVPDGKSRIVGKVLVADNPQQSLANLVVTVVSTPTGKQTVSYRVITDAQGQFSVDGIVTGKHLANGPLSVTNVVVSVDPAKTPYQAQKVSLLLTENRATEVVLAMPPTAFDVNQVGGVSISSPATNSSGVVSGTTFQFVARLLNHNNMPLISAQTGNYVVPSLVLDGLMVTGIGSDGTFQAVGSQVGVSSITGQINVPGATQAIVSPRLDLPVQPTTTTSVSNSGQSAQTIPSPPMPPR